MFQPTAWLLLCCCFAVHGEDMFSRGSIGEILGTDIAACRKEGPPSLPEIPHQKALFLGYVSSGSPLEKAGVKSQRFILTTLDGRIVGTEKELRVILGGLKPSQEVRVSGFTLTDSGWNPEDLTVTAERRDKVIMAGFHRNKEKNEIWWIPKSPTSAESTGLSVSVVEREGEIILLRVLQYVGTKNMILRKAQFRFNNRVCELPTRNLNADAFARMPSNVEHKETSFHPMSPEERKTVQAWLTSTRNGKPTLRLCGRKEAENVVLETPAIGDIFLGFLLHKYLETQERNTTRTHFPRYPGPTKNPQPTMKPRRTSKDSRGGRR